MRRVRTTDKRNKTIVMTRVKRNKILAIGVNLVEVLHGYSLLIEIHSE
jgi:hypothetical protein